MDIVYIEKDKSKLSFLNEKKITIIDPPTESRESFLRRMKEKFSLSPGIIIDGLKL
tara:strand:+ start:405 stop:572 length:168 start_codon:yes stop_codon:yes gene_type:complete